MVALLASSAPLVATMTGSKTIGPAKLSSRAATAFAISGEPSIPILMASAPMSERQESICASTSSTGSISTAWTPLVFCAVIAVSAVMA